MPSSGSVLTVGTSPKVYQRLINWSKKNGKIFGEDYFEKGKNSSYQSYHWNQTLLFPRVDAIINSTGLRPNQKILDFGCAKGFYVRRFCQLGYKAEGVDISKYALSKCFADTKERLFLLKDFSLLKIKNNFYDLILAKDVLEHVPQFAIAFLSKQLKRISKKVLVIVPCCQPNHLFINPEDEKDTTHLLRFTADKWKKLLGKGEEKQKLRLLFKGKKNKGTLCYLVSKKY